MDKKDCFELGYIIKKHSYKGDLAARFESDDPDRYMELDALFLDMKGQLVPFIIEKCEHLKQDNYLLHFEGYNSEADIQKLLGCSIYLPLEFLPELSDEEFYYHEVVGYTVIDERLGAIGPISEIRNDTVQDILMTEKDGMEVLIPLAEHIFKGIDKKKKEFYIDAPEGLIELYLDADKDINDEED